eukprot:Gb_18630 [translate_table: standard]
MHFLRLYFTINPNCKAEFGSDQQDCGPTTDIPSCFAKSFAADHHRFILIDMVIYRGPQDLQLLLLSPGSMEVGQWRPYSDFRKDSTAPILPPRRGKIRALVVSSSLQQVKFASKALFKASRSLIVRYYFCHRGLLSSYAEAEARVLKLGSIPVFFFMILPTIFKRKSASEAAEKEPDMAIGANMQG